MNNKVWAKFSEALRSNEYTKILRKTKTDGANTLPMRNAIK